MLWSGQRNRNISSSSDNSSSPWPGKALQLDTFSKSSAARVFLRNRPSEVGISMAFGSGKGFVGTCFSILFCCRLSVDSRPPSVGIASRRCIIRRYLLLGLAFAFLPPCRASRWRLFPPHPLQRRQCRLFTLPFLSRWRLFLFSRLLS